MDPSLQEYFHTLESMKEELFIVKSHQKELKDQLSKLYEENKQLTRELKESVQMRLQERSESETGILQQKLEAAIVSKNSAIEMWQNALRELERQEDVMLGKKSIISAERNEVEKQILQMREEYTKGLNILSQELANTRTELTNCKKELEGKTGELSNLKTKFDSAALEISANKEIIEELSNANSGMEEKISSLQSLLSETEKFLFDSKEEIFSLRTENSELSASVLDMKEQNKKVKSEITMYEKDAKESLLTAQEAVLQTKEMAYREEQFVKEIELLKSSLDLEIEKVGVRYKSEIKEIQKQASEKIKSLMDEIQLLHAENSEKQTMFEKALREKQALESKIELLFSENSNGMPVSMTIFDDVCNRLTMAERARDEFELKSASLQTKLDEVRSAKDQELQYVEAELTNIKERYKNLLKDFNDISSDRIKLSTEVTKLKKRCSELDKELKFAKTKYSNELSAFEEDLRQKQHTYTEHLQLSEEHYKSVCSELQTLLDAEFKISNKWKNEMEDIITKSEIKIKELCQNIILLKNQNNELLNVLQQNNVLIPNASVHGLHLFSDIASL